MVDGSEIKIKIQDCQGEDYLILILLDVFLNVNGMECPNTVSITLLVDNSSNYQVLKVFCPYCYLRFKMSSVVSQ